MSFLPEGTEIPKGSSNYMKFTEPENKFRVLDGAIAGYELWMNGKPTRRKRNDFTAQERFEADINKFTGKQKTPEYFWAFPVYNYQTQKIEILEVKQVSVINGINNLLQDEDYGSDPKKYDIVVVRTEEGKQVKYSVKPKPPKDLDPEILKLYKGMSINLEALFTGEDPFAPQVDSKVVYDEELSELGF